MKNENNIENKEELLLDEEQKEMIADEFAASLDELQKEITADEKQRKDSKIVAKRGRLIKLIKKEINRIKNLEDITPEQNETLQNLEEKLKEQLENHKEHLDLYYKERFLKEKATVSAIFTALPRGVAIKVRKIVNCIDELKIAETNKEKTFGSLELMKTIGMLVATPAIFATKFALRHWYLILLLLKFDLDFDELKDKLKNRNNNTDTSDVLETNPAYDPALETQLGLATQTTTSTVTSTVTNATESAATSTATNATESAVTSTATNATESAATSTATSTATGTTTGTATDPEILLTGSQQSLAASITEDFVNQLETNYNFFIADRHPDVIVVHSAQEYYDAVFSITGNPPFSVETANQYYEKFCGQGHDNLYQPVIWPELETEGMFFASSSDLINYIVSGENANLTAYANKYAEKLTNGTSGLNITQQQLNNISQVFGTGATGMTLFLLYEIIQYGLAIPTHGMSLAAPF